ncbi:MAG: class I SAM-dependent RNA methyltransferase [Saprospiraceae bacterium]
MNLLAKTLQGLEEVLAEELKALGAKRIKIFKRAVEFEGDKTLLYRANLELRTAIRILMPIKTFRVRHESALYSKIKSIDWTSYMGLKETFAIDATIHSPYFNHSKYVALKSKDAIADQFREKFDRRPNVNIINPSLRVNIHINDDNCIVSLDSSGDSLHRRAYRQEKVEAPINEVLAAGMILLSGWKRDCLFMDAMCGSGTLAIEAALYAYNIPPQWQRDYFCFKKWRDFDPQLWASIRETAKNNFRKHEFPILASDLDFKAVRITERNILTADIEGKIEVQRKKFEKLEPPQQKGILMLNPPYDERLAIKDIKAFYSEIGDKLKNSFSGYEAWIISSNIPALKRIGLRPSRKISLYNGTLECKFLKFEMYDGSKKTNRKPKEDHPSES